MSGSPRRSAARRGAGRNRGRGPACGAGLALLRNPASTLPAGLVAARVIVQGRLPKPGVDAPLVGVGLGPNLSVTGSLATLPWLAALRRDGLDVSFRQLLARGLLLVMPPALLLALASPLLRRGPSRRGLPLPARDLGGPLR